AWRQLPPGERPRVARAVTPPLVAAVVAGAAMAGATALYGAERSKLLDAVGLAGIGAAGAVVYLALVAALGGPRPSSIVARVRGRAGG
ncbi:MAG: hypothetical protein JWM05_1232, partial [Acidimicrobiales bacterium]|nr:hypothetical protein [Acidimicrobiales bacterium]